MQPLYHSCTPLDRRCYEAYGVSEDLLMENAGRGMAEYILSHFPRGSSLLIVVGVGNNGADGLVLARHLFRAYEVRLYIPYRLKSTMAKKQFERIKKIGIEVVDEVKESDIVVDALFGAGLSRGLDEGSLMLLRLLNQLAGFKIAYDIPSGIDAFGNPLPEAFCADVTITMGALKEALYSDYSKDCVGEVICVDLGVDRQSYEMPSDTYLLEECDLKLPSRTQHNSHKGSYGHLAVIGGDMHGASLLSAMASLRFGVGLVSMVSASSYPLPATIMRSSMLPRNTTAIALGMGLGQEEGRIEAVLQSTAPLILDADILYHERIMEFLAQKSRQIVITPHPKEFVALFCSAFQRHVDIDLNVEGLQRQRLYYAREFSKLYPHVTLILKGANSIIAHNQRLFINPHGSSRLSKGGSGDVLAGLVGALLAQGYSSLDASIHASLALTLGAKRYEGSSYGMIATDLIEEIATLERRG
jgi:hydroxyethylthiazole kinase-like uncharacterized protein yjeF